MNARTGEINNSTFYRILLNLVQRVNHLPLDKDKISKSKINKQKKKLNKIFDSNLIMPVYKLKKLLQKAPKESFKMNKRKQKLVNLRLLMNMENIAYLEFFVTADAKADSSTIIFSSHQTLPATFEFQGILPIE